MNILIQTVIIHQAYMESQLHRDYRQHDKLGFNVTGSTRRDPRRDHGEWSRCVTGALKMTDMFQVSE